MLFNERDCEFIIDHRPTTGMKGEIVEVSVRHKLSTIHVIDTVHVDGDQKDSQANALRDQVILDVKTQVEALP